jgi:hypothetical protein
MKSFIILILSVALLAAAFFTRPSQQDFKRFVVQHKTQNDNNVISKVVDQAVAEHFADGCTYRDNYLWTSVQRDGKTLFTGAFSHWFSHAAVKDQINTLDQKVNERVKQVDQQIHKA